MSYSTASKTVSLLTAVSLAGCASMNTYPRVDAEPVARSANYKGEVPAGIVEDAMRLDGSAPLFDDAIYKKIETAVKSAKDLQTVQRNIRDVICDGSTARVQPKLTVHLVLSKPPKGEPLDAVAEHNRVFISETRTYLKGFWLDSGSRTDLMGKAYNSDFEQYERNMVTTGMERRSASSLISVGLPFLPGVSAKDAEVYFANSRAMPTLRPISETGPIDWSPSRSYLSVSFPKEHYVVLSNKVSDMVLAVWGFNGYGTEMKSSVAHNVQFTPETTFQYFGISDGFMFRNSAHYMATGNS